MPAPNLTFRRALAIAAVAVALTAADAGATQETKLWETVGNWQVRSDPTIQDSCYIAGYYPRSGVFLRIGMIGNGAGYVALGSDYWSSLRQGQQVPLQFYIGTHPWSVTAKVTTVEWGPTLWVRIADFRVLTDVAAGSSLLIYYEGNLVGDFSLDQSGRAVRSMVECQNAMHHPTDPFANRPTPSDPFATRPTTPRDPFNRM
jgi:hypothetical protein